MHSFNLTCAIYYIRFCNVNNLLALFDYLIIYYHGGFLVAISNTVHPMLQQSDFVPWPNSLATSGAIQKGVPFID